MSLQVEACKSLCTVLYALYILLMLRRQHYRMEAFPSAWVLSIRDEQSWTYEISENKALREIKVLFVTAA